MKNILGSFLFAGALLFLAGCTGTEQSPTYKQWHTVTLDFKGPETSEQSEVNPFLNYRLSVLFKHKEAEYQVRGFFAADGNAAETGAASGNVWQVRFTPDKIGEWTYSAMLHQGDGIALDGDLKGGTEVAITDAKGKFTVVESDKEGVDFRAQGRIEAAGKYFRFTDSGKYWIKGGANSPENLLAYKDFDGTYRISESTRKGESNTTGEIHSFSPHLRDWSEGDPSWQGGKGKEIIGAINYLASKGMNAVYFLVMNINGDGNDVWPYATPEDFSRFDVSKLAQWEIVFQHMQAKGIMLHIPLQETENETLLDDGNTGTMRQLYLLEMIARFGHHLALKWNIGEENGPADWTPIAQNDRQRKDMISYIKQHDPYHHPVLLHTHSSEPVRAQVLDSILAFQALDGLSLQQGERKEVADVIQEWQAKSEQAGEEWMITMDEIGEWDTGALPDSLDPQHETLRSYVLWGSLLSGAAGVEWYFGANNTHNDLTSEDWRRRERLWELTNHALTFFRENLLYWEMEPKHDLADPEGAYCFRKANEIYAVYLPDSGPYSLNLANAEGEFSIQWFDPLLGGRLQAGSVSAISGGGVRELGHPPAKMNPAEPQDWVVLVSRKK